MLRISKPILFLLLNLIWLSSCVEDDIASVEDNMDDDLPAILPTSNYVNYYDSSIVFFFEEDYEVGQFANGDYWVHNNGGAVIINRIFPDSEVTSTQRIINGTMINPADDNRQGYDSSPRDMEFDETLNVDPGFTSNDLSVLPGTSVVKSISMPDDAGRPIIQDAAVLTVLASAPEEGAFRPPYTGNDKSVVGTIHDLKYEVLGNHPKPSNVPDIAVVAEGFERVWLEHNTEWTQRDLHPKNNMPTYGRDIANASAEGLILLQLDYTPEEKEKLLIGLVQYGIDIYGVAKNGGNWYNNGGHNLGRKMPLLLAAKVLGDEEMMKYADKEQHFIFQDDQQHFYVSQAEVDLTNSPAWSPDARAEIEPYQSSDIGMAEWGIRHADRPEGDNKHWTATYRDVNGPAQISHVLAANLMGVRADWNWEPVFDYAERYFSIDGAKLEDYRFELWEYYLETNDD